MKSRKALLHHRYFEVGTGWSDWILKEVEVIDETEECYKIRDHILFGYSYYWIYKISYSDKIEFLKVE